ncbi:hypothetical protein SNARM312S_02191 [Streptomyces narbonensis]
MSSAVTVSAATTVTEADTAKVEIRSVHKSFGTLHVLRGIDLDVRAGEVTVVLGPSGSGKSTLLRTINHLEKVDSGTVSVDGTLVGYRLSGNKLYELRERDILKQRTRIGFVFQNFHLFPHLTVLENIVEAPVSAHEAPPQGRRGRGPQAPRPRRTRRQGGGVPQAALRRTAAAGRHRPRARPGTGAAALRRADLRARPRAGRRGPRRHQGPGRLRDAPRVAGDATYDSGYRGELGGDGRSGSTGWS